jgi:ADP-heptose:LPS heptosyltransferase
MGQVLLTAGERIAALEGRVSALEKGMFQPEINQEVPGVNIQEAVGVIRDFALGDLVMLSPALKALKQKHPERPLVFVTRPELFDVLAGADYLDAQLPKEGYEYADFYRKYDLCRAVETEAGGKLSLEEYLNKSRPDIFAEKLRVPGGAEKFPVPVNPVALSKMRGILGNLKPPLIGVAPTCGSVVRAMPPQYVAPLAEKLLAAYGGTVILLGKVRRWNRNLLELRLPGVLNLIDSLSVAELIAAISLLQAMISPDTGTMHLAGALGVKCLCLMGNNDPRCFSAFYPTVKTIQPTELSCVPCHDRSIPCTPLPRGQVGANCMQAMNPERVMGEFQKFYNGKNIAYLHDTDLSFVGGAEITTKGMVKAGREMGYNVRLFDRDTPVEQFYSLYGYDLIILSNIWRLPKETMAVIMQAIRHVPYVKYEHDHDGLGPSPQGYPKAEFAEKIYAGSALNIFVSPAHMADYAPLGPGICIPELLDTEMFKPVKGVKRQPDTTLVAIPGKWSKPELDRFTGTHKNVTVLQGKVPHQDMPALYSQYETFAHFPARKWPCDRVIFEAALCGCKVVAGEIVEALSWGKDLADQKSLRAWLKQVPEQFWGEINRLVEGRKRV